MGLNLVNSDEFSRSLCCDQSSLIPLSIIWMWELSTPSVFSKIKVSCVGVLMCWRVGGLYRRIWRGWIKGCRPTGRHSTRPSARSCTWVTANTCSAAGWGQISWKSGPVGKDLGVLDSWLNKSQPVPSGQEGQWHPGLYQEQWPAGPGHWLTPVLGTGKSMSQILSSFLGPSLQKDLDVLVWLQRRATELLSGHESCEELLRELGLFTLEKKRTGGNLIAFYNCWKRACSKLEVGLFSHVSSERISDDKGLAFCSGYVISAALCAVFAYTLLEKANSFSCQVLYLTQQCRESV